jgi:myo-inositol-1(or 4)-monophosphatase
MITVGQNEKKKFAMNKLPGMEELRSILDVAIEAARRAGEVLRTHLGRVTAREKAPADLVTEADWAAQEVIVQVIRRHYPTHQLVTEEGPSSSACSMDQKVEGKTQESGNSSGPDAGYRWHIDPLDGTTNFFHGFPLFATCIGVEFGGKVVAGCIYNPLTDQVFHATRGGGAWLGDRRLRTSGCRRFEDALVAVALPARVDFNSAEFRLFLSAINRCQSIRRTGCTSLNLAFTAAGWLDAAWGLSCHSWDLAAGMLLVEEAGGAVGDVGRRPFSLASGRIFAAGTAELLEAIYSLAEPLGLA